MSYSYKQWTQDQTADNVIHASDLERWQDGITDAGGTWSGSWTDEKDTLTAEQLNALETEIASLYGTGFTAKTWEDGQVPGVDEWNRIEDAINTILNRTAFAIYCETDNSLTFYVDTEVPEVGDTYDGKVVTAVFTNVDSARYSSTSLPPWNAYADSLKAITFDGSFAMAKLTYLAYWFYSNGMSATFTGLNYMDVSSVTNMAYMFQGCTGLTSLSALYEWDVSSVTNMAYMFQGCTGLTSLSALYEWDVSSATNLGYMFSGCTGLTNLNGLEKWDTANNTSLLAFIYQCSNIADISAITGWNTSSCTSFQSLFYGTIISGDIDLSKWNTAKATTITNVFYGCDGITSLDLTGWDTSAATNMNNMFRTCRALKTVYVSEGQFNIDNVTTSSNMFTNCTSIVGGNGTTFDSSKIDASMAHIDTEDNPGYFTAKG